MNAAWALCLFAAAFDGTTTPPPPQPTSLLIPDTLTGLLASRPELLYHHEGFLKELAARPDLAQTETAWWQASSVPSLRKLAVAFEDALADSRTAQLRFDAFYKKLTQSPEARIAVETLVRTELEQARSDPALPRALRFLRANPDIALRFLKDPTQVRPLPEPLERAYAAFERRPEWTQALFTAFDAVAQSPDAFVTVFPWWQELNALERAQEAPALDDELYKRPNEYWKWHQRNLSLADDEQAAPWMRYWSGLIHRDADLAREYGPFITELLQEPEQLRQHLITLQKRHKGKTTPWPPKTAPPKLEPLMQADQAEKLRRSIQRPTIDRPDKPNVGRPQRPTRPTPPARPASTSGLSPIESRRE